MENWLLSPWKALKTKQKRKQRAQFRCLQFWTSIMLIIWFVLSSTVTKPDLFIQTKSFTMSKWATTGNKWFSSALYALIVNKITELYKHFVPQKHCIQLNWIKNRFRVETFCLLNKLFCSVLWSRIAFGLDWIVHLVKSFKWMLWKSITN